MTKGDLKQTITLAISFMFLNSFFEDYLMSTIADFIFIMLVIISKKNVQLKNSNLTNEKKKG